MWSDQMGFAIEKVSGNQGLLLAPAELSGGLRSVAAPSISPRTRPGLTLIEVLAVIAIIGLLAGLLLPAINAIRETTREASCRNNLRQMGLAVLHYDSVFDAFPPASTGYNGITFFPLITRYLDDGFASAFGNQLDLNAPGQRVSQPSVDAQTMAGSAANASLLGGMPQFPFLTCPTRGHRVSRHTNGGAGTSINCDYGIIVSDTSTPGRLGLRDTLCPGAGFCPGGCNPKATPHAGCGVLQIALGREKVTQEQYDALPSNWKNPAWALGGGWCYYYVWPSFYTNMIDLVQNHDGGFNQSPSGSPPPVEKRFQRPYEGWVSRIRAASVPDGLSMTALVAEKHLSARELGRFGGYYERRPLGANAGHVWGNDSSPQVGGGGGYVLQVHATRGIARGPGDESNPHYPKGGEPCAGEAWSGNCVSLGPTIGSWHADGNVNFLMADGSVRVIGADIDTLFMLPMLGTRNDVEIRTDGRVLMLP
jgi:prepilin-type N-terminal cleavage/methylation domain-containing protein/prepilin-type processing-associated H-X9-DG protein